MSAKSTKQKESNSVDLLDDVSTVKSSSKKGNTLQEYSKTAPFSFNVKNYKILLIGLAINILGFILMMGGAAEDPNDFSSEELFSHTRITIAPMLIVLGYLVIMYSIMKKPKSSSK
jgi:hypothetical protein